MIVSVRMVGWMCVQSVAAVCAMMLQRGGQKVGACVYTVMQNCCGGVGWATACACSCGPACDVTIVATQFGLHCCPTHDGIYVVIFVQSCCCAASSGPPACWATHEGMCVVILVQSGGRIHDGMCVAMLVQSVGPTPDVTMVAMQYGWH